MTLGWRSGLKRTARERLTAMINAVWMMSNGNAKFKGLSPCHAPLDEVFTAVMLKVILEISLDSFVPLFSSLFRKAIFFFCKPERLYLELGI